MPCVTFYSYVHNGHRLNFFRLAISLNNCLENYAMNTERMGENSSANLVVNGSSLFGDFGIL